MLQLDSSKKADKLTFFCPQTICQKTPENTAEYFAAVWALHAMSKVLTLRRNRTNENHLCFVTALEIVIWVFSSQKLVTSCNDGARRMERTEQMYTIQKQMDFGKIKVRIKQSEKNKDKSLDFKKNHRRLVILAIPSGVLITMAEEAW